MIKTYATGCCNNSAYPLKSTRQDLAASKTVCRSKSFHNHKKWLYASLLSKIRNHFYICKFCNNTRQNSNRKHWKKRKLSKGMINLNVVNCQNKECRSKILQDSKYCPNCGTEQSKKINEERISLIDNDYNEKNDRNDVNEESMDIHACYFKTCHLETTSKCVECEKWTCDIHLSAVDKHGEYLDIIDVVLICDDCKHKSRHLQQIAFIVLLLCLLLGCVILVKIHQ